jgi:hypothetical protein
LIRIFVLPYRDVVMSQERRRPVAAMKITQDVRDYAATQGVRRIRLSCKG